MTEKTESLVYLYDAETKEYLGSQEADLDPVATQREGKPVILLPANATLIAPPKKQVEYHTYVFKNNKWVSTPDYRGETVINQDFNTTIVNNLGELEEGFVPVTEEQNEVLQQDSLKLKWTEKGLVPNPDYEKDKADREKENQKREIQSQLNAIDTKSIRALRAWETEYLAKYEKEAQTLRDKLQNLQ